MPLLAAFVAPALLSVGAIAVSVPILIHWLTRRRYKRIRWAATEFLLQAEKRNRRRLRMEEWILLALRCLAVALLAMMVARPFLSPQSGAAAWGGSRRVERVFMLDDSLSMAYESEDGSSFARAKLAVRRLIEAIRRETPDDTVTLLRMTAPRQPIVFGAYLDDAQTESFLARLQAMSPTQRAVDPAEAMAGAAEVLGRGSGILNAAVYVLGDFQRAGWMGREEAPSAAMMSPLTEWAGKQRGLRLVFVNVGDPAASNWAVTELSMSSGPRVAGTTATVRAEASNFGDRDVENLALRAAVGHLAGLPKTLPRLAARQQTSVEIEVEFIRPGEEGVRVELPPDGLPADNVRHVVVDVANAVRVLIVNGEPSADGFDDEATFLSTALRPEGEVFSGNEVVVVDETQFESEDLHAFQTIILANVYRLSEPGVAAIERFAKLGGGVIVFLGDQVDASLYNAMLYRDGAGLLPAGLGEVVRAPDEAHLLFKDRLHPAIVGIDREGDPLGIGRIPFRQYFACTPFTLVEGDPNALPESGPTSVIARRPARILAAFDDAVEHAAVVERPFGAGRVLLVATTADKEWHSWPDHPTFLPVMMELVRYVARGSASSDELFVGAPIELPVSPTEFDSDALVRTPAYPSDNEVSVTAGAAPDGEEWSFRWDRTESSGLYQFVLRRRDGREEVKQVAVNVDPRESDLTSMSAEELRRTLKGVPFEYIQGLDKLPEVTGESRTEFWRVVLFAMAGALMLEQTLAWRWGRRR